MGPMPKFSTSDSTPEGFAALAKICPLESSELLRDFVSRVLAGLEFQCDDLDGVRLRKFCKIVSKIRFPIKP